MSASGGVDWHDFGLPHGLDIANWRLAEEAAVLAIELAYAFVVDFIRRRSSVNSVHQHALPRCLKPQLLLVLERAHRGQFSELMMQS